jgi:cell division protein FtsL
MNNVSHIVTKVRQAPWRVQRQWIGLFLLALVFMAMVASIYLTVTNRATLAGRETNSLRNTITANEQVNADLESSLAGLTSYAAMQQRAEAMGFEADNLDEITYLAVPGYAPPSAVDFSIPESDQPVRPVILPEYSESWFEYFINPPVSTNRQGLQP